MRTGGFGLDANFGPGGRDGEGLLRGEGEGLISGTMGVGSRFLIWTAPGPVRIWVIFYGGQAPQTPPDSLRSMSLWGRRWFLVMCPPSIYPQAQRGPGGFGGACPPYESRDRILHRCRTALRSATEGEPAGAGRGHVHSLARFRPREHAREKSSGPPSERTQLQRDMSCSAQEEPRRVGKWESGKWEKWARTMYRLLHRRHGSSHVCAMRLPGLRKESDDRATTGRLPVPGGCPGMAEGGPAERAQCWASRCG